MKNKSTVVGLGLLAIGVLSFAGVATYSFANFSKDVLANVFDRQVVNSNYENSGIEKHGVADCKNVEERDEMAIGGLNKVNDLNCENLR